MNDGVGGVEKDKKRICKYGCGEGRMFSNRNNTIYLCDVPIDKCERDGKKSLSYTKDGSLMG